VTLPGADNSRSTVPFGVMGVAPRRPIGDACTSIVPRAMGGNMDNKELVAGTKVYFLGFQ